MGAIAHRDRLPSRQVCLEWMKDFKLTTNVKKAIAAVPWDDWQGKSNEGLVQLVELRLQLHGWSLQRRVIVERTLKPLNPSPQGSFWKQCEEEFNAYVTNLTAEEADAFQVIQLYRQRADAENVFDELKNQWGWAGFTTQDLDRCQVTARLIAQIYNWWSLYARLVDRERHREAVTTRPELLGGVARQTRHAGQTRISVNLSHAKTNKIQAQLAEATAFLQGLVTTAEQLTNTQRWERILLHIFEKFISLKLLNSCPPVPAPG